VLERCFGAEGRQSSTIIPAVEWVSERRSLTKALGIALEEVVGDFCDATMNALEAEEVSTRKQLAGEASAPWRGGAGARQPAGGMRALAGGKGGSRESRAHAC
jgi:hypothetical protein